MLHWYELVFPHLRIYLFFTAHFDRRESEWVFRYAQFIVFGLFALFIRQTAHIDDGITGLLLDLKYPPLHDRPVVFYVRHNAQPVEPGVICEYSILGGDWLLMIGLGWVQDGVVI